jgi:predicted O-methyltransferase YrrM
MDFFFKLQRKNNRVEILNTAKSELYLDKKITTDHNNAIKRLKEKIKVNKDVKYVYERYSNVIVDNQYYLWFLIGFDINNSYSITAHDFDSDYHIKKIIESGGSVDYVGPIKDIKNKYKNIIYNTQSKYLYEKIAKYDSCKRESLLHNTKLRTISHLFDFLEEGGSFYIAFQGYCENGIIEILYILSFMFEYVIIYNSIYVLCKNFNSVLRKSDIEKVINKVFSIEPKNDLENLIKYLNNNLKYQIFKYNLLIENKEEEFLDTIKSEILDSVKYYNPDKIDKVLLDFNFSIMKNFKMIYVDNKLIKTSSGINSNEGTTIVNIIKKYNFKKCLEVGMAYGISAFYILSNIDTTLISIDPYQDTQWLNYGMNLLKEFDFNKRHKLYKLKSYVVLPKLLKELGDNYFDFIFIDGFHTFDYTLVDIFYASLLLKVNGIIIIDDALHPGVKKCIDYIITNYKFYKKLESINSMAVFMKYKEDERDWNFHYNF